MRNSPYQGPKGYDPFGARSACKINKAHCEECGSDLGEDIDASDDGYSLCCNEIITWSGDCRGFHLQRS